MAGNQNERSARKGGAMPKPDAAGAVASAYYILQLLPLDPDEAEPILAMAERALAHEGEQPDGWNPSANHVLSHLQKRKQETAAATLAVARDILNAVRPHFA
jgi:hypothetical protein